MDTGIIILAAGSSSRLGTPKQLLTFNGQSLIRHIVCAATKDAGHAVVIVTGANAAAVETELKGYPVLFSHNASWEQGMGSSITSGLRQLLLVYPALERCIICVCDQPYTDDTLLQFLKKEQLQSRKEIAASAYSGTLGVPVLFTRQYFDHLLNLKGKEGAKKIIEAHIHDVAAVSFEPGAIDIDTIEDYTNLLQDL